jgi:hypothetical protein
LTALEILRRFYKEFPREQLPLCPSVREIEPASRDFLLRFNLHIVWAAIGRFLKLINVIGNLLIKICVSMNMLIIFQSAEYLRFQTSPSVPMIIDEIEQILIIINVLA